MAYCFDRVASAAGLIARIADHEITIIERFRESILDAETAARKRLTKIAKGASQEYVESLAEDHDILFERVRPLTGALAILALYRIVEMNTKRIRRSCWGNRKVERCYKIKILNRETANGFPNRPETSRKL